MKITLNDFKTFVLRLDDHNDKANSSIKLVHVPTGLEIINCDTNNQNENQRIAAKELIINLINKNKNINQPEFYLYEEVKVLLNERNRTERHGILCELNWHYKDNRWNYYIKVDGKKISKRYFSDDLTLDKNNK